MADWPQYVVPLAHAHCGLYLQILHESQIYHISGEKYGGLSSFIGRVAHMYHTVVFSITVSVTPNALEPRLYAH